MAMTVDEVTLVAPLLKRRYLTLLMVFIYDIVACLGGGCLDLDAWAQLGLSLSIVTVYEHRSKIVKS